MIDLNKMFTEATAQKTPHTLSHTELLHHEFEASDPENLPGVSKSPPPDEQAEVEFWYNMSGRTEMVECVYCRKPNHYKGIVVRYPSGSRRLVGRDCALKHHGADFNDKLIEFDTIVEHQGYARRQEVLRRTIPAVYRELNNLLEHPAVSTFDGVLKSWRNNMPDLAAALADICRRDSKLTYERQVVDVDAEKTRRAKLGDRFEQERQKAKQAGLTWRLFRRELVDLGKLEGTEFFGAGLGVRPRLTDIHRKLRQTLNVLSDRGLAPRQFRAGARKLSEIRDALEHEIRRLESLPDAFDADMLLLIAQWANEQYLEQIRRECAVRGEKIPSIPERFVASGQSITEIRSGHRISVFVPEAYHAPKRTLIAALKEAASATYEP